MGDPVRFPATASALSYAQPPSGAQQLDACIHSYRHIGRCAGRFAASLYSRFRRRHHHSQGGFAGLIIGAFGSARPMSPSWGKGMRSIGPKSLPQHSDSRLGHVGNRCHDVQGYIWSVDGACGTGGRSRTDSSASESAPAKSSSALLKVDPSRPNACCRQSAIRTLRFHLLRRCRERERHSGRWC